MSTTCGTQARGCGLWQSVQATPLMLVDRGVPGHGRRAVWHLQAQVLPAGFLDLAVRVVAGGAVETVGAANLVRAGDLLEVLHVAVATVANPRRHGAQVLWDVPRSEGRFLAGGLYPWPPALPCPEVW